MSSLNSQEEEVKKISKEEKKISKEEKKILREEKKILREKKKIEREKKKIEREERKISKEEKASKRESRQRQKKKTESKPPLLVPSEDDYDEARGRARKATFHRLMEALEIAEEAEAKAESFEQYVFFSDQQDQLMGELFANLDEMLEILGIPDEIPSEDEDDSGIELVNVKEVDYDSLFEQTDERILEFIKQQQELGAALNFEPIE